MVFWMFVCIPAAGADEVAGSDKANNKTKTVATETGYLENVILGKMPGKERIALVISQQL